MPRGIALGEEFTDAKPDSGTQRRDTPFLADFRRANPTIWKHLVLGFVKRIAFASAGWFEEATSRVNVCRISSIPLQDYCGRYACYYGPRLLP
jgi:hypothetical protein